MRWQHRKFPHLNESYRLLKVQWQRLPLLKQWHSLAVALLTDLFSDNLVLWGSHDGSGGYYRKRQTSSLAKLFSKEGARYVWSGPVRDHS